MIFCDMKSAYEFVAMAKRILCGGPDGPLFISPLSHCCARFQRRMLYISDVIGLFERLSGLCQLFWKRIRGKATVGVLLQVIIELSARWMRRWFPFRGLSDRCQGLLCNKCGRGCDAHKL